MTVQRAIRTLADEGFVRTKSGSGVYVRDQASLPAPEEAEHPLAGAADFLFEMGHLKRVNRAGWLLLGITQPESVAEHSFRVGITGIVLAAMEGADVGRIAALCIMHDSHETRIGDVPSVGRAYITSAAPEAVSAHQTAAMPSDVAKVLQDLKAEYEAGETVEARVARDADKLETLLQAMEYQAQGHDTAPWQETSIDALRTDSAQAAGAGDQLGRPSRLVVGVRRVLPRAARWRAGPGTEARRGWRVLMPKIRSYTLPDGSRRYWFRVDTGRGPDGKRIQERQTFERKSDAQAELARIVSERRQGTYVRPSNETVGELIDEYLRSATFEKEAATVRSYTDALRCRAGAARPPQAAGRHPARRRGPARLHAARGPQDRRQGGHRARAAQRQPGARPPAGRVRDGRGGGPPRPQPRRARQAAPAGARRAADVDAGRGARVPGRGGRGPAARGVAAVAVRAAPRRGHGAALGRLRPQGEDADRVAEPGAGGRGDHREDAEEPESVRVLPLDDAVVAALDELRKRQMAEGAAAAPAYEASGYVVTDELGRPVHPEWYTDEFHRLAKRAGVRRIRLHESRHTALSLMEKAGVPVSIIAAWAGHDSGAFTMGQYVHANPEDLAAGRDALAAIYGTGRPS